MIIGTRWKRNKISVMSSGSRIAEKEVKVDNPIPKKKKKSRGIGCPNCKGE